MSRLRLLLLAAVLFSGGAEAGHAHMLNITQARVTFDDTQQFTAEIDVDFSRPLGTGDAYYALSLLPHDQQEAKIRELVAPLLTDLHFDFGNQTVLPELTGWSVPASTRQVYNDYYIGKMTRIDLKGTIPDDRPQFVLETLSQTTIEFPLVLTVERPNHHVHVTRWLELQGISSDPFNYDQGVASGGVIAKDRAVDPLSGAKLTPWQRFWYVQLGALGRYFQLGFQHILPAGWDHILFVLGLFFLGISWRKLIAQTTVFTIAHATTLYLSTQNLFTLPMWLVQPGIALSITFIALENIFKPKLNAFRLLVVFCFGLLHGLGFASTLKQLQLPAHEFFMALLGFNLGVDFGQIVILLMAFFLLGWCRNKSWYFSRITVPASGAIAAVGAVWAVQRILFYVQIATL